VAFFKELKLVVPPTNKGFVHITALGRRGKKDFVTTVLSTVQYLVLKSVMMVGGVSNLNKNY
jgi:ABC-type molybdate transport system permease subunit